MFENFKFNFHADLKRNKHGYLDPIIYAIDIEFGDSFLYHDDQVLAFIMHQFILLAIVMIQNVTYFAGETLFSNMMGPVIDGWLTHYR